MSDLVVDNQLKKPACKKILGLIPVNKCIAAIPYVITVFIILCILLFRKDYFTSSDGAASRRSQNQVRGDPSFDSAEWNLKALEESVASLNKKLGAN